MLSGEAVDKYSELGLESDENENGLSYPAMEYYNVRNECLQSFRIQCEPADENDEKKRLRIVGNRDMKQCDTYKSLEYVIFFGQ